MLTIHLFSSVNGEIHNVFILNELDQHPKYIYGDKRD